MTPKGASISPTEIVERVRARIKVGGLQPALQDFEAMERILSGLGCWPEVKGPCEELFADERRNEQRAELERLKASAPTVFQMLPTAQAGVNVDGGLLPGSLTQKISGSQVFNGNITNSEFKG